jgi:hypothetical protein
MKIFGSGLTKSRKNTYLKNRGNMLYKFHILKEEVNTNATEPPIRITSSLY